MDKPAGIDGAARRILVVDDQPLIRDLLVHLLVDTGYHAFAAGNGRDGLTLARMLPFDLILLDVDMPSPNGLEVCAALKSDPATAGVPVLFVSARLGRRDREQMAAVGGAGFLPKPFLATQVRRAVSLVLGPA